MDAILLQIIDTSSVLVVADGGSTDGTVARIQAAAERNPQVRYFHNDKRLQSAAINAVIAEYGGYFEAFVRVDAHASYPDDFIGRLTQDAERTEAASVTVSMKTVGTTAMQQAIATAQNSALGNGASDHRSASAGGGKWVDHGHHALMRVVAFQRVGGYDETFGHNEDAELDFRLTRAGYRIWLTSGTVMTYYPRRTIRSLGRQYFGFGAGRARTILKHKIKPRLRQVLPALLVPFSLPAVFFFLAWPLALPFLTWLGLVAIGSLWVGRKTSETFSLSGAMRVFAAVATMHLAWSFGFCRSLVAYAFGHRDHNLLER